MLGTFNVHTDVNACSFTRGPHRRLKKWVWTEVFVVLFSLKVDPGRRIPCHIRVEPAPAACQTQCITNRATSLSPSLKQKKSYKRVVPWSGVYGRIQYKIALTCFHIISGTALPYLTELLHLYSPSRSLRSASDTWIFRVPRVCRRTLGERSFQFIGPVIWNSLSLLGMPRHSPLLNQN